MTDEGLVGAIAAGTIDVPYFGGATVAIENIAELPLDEIIPVLGDFCSLTIHNRRSDARHLLACCHAMMRAIGGDQVRANLGGVDPTLDNIWSFVQPSLLYFARGTYAGREHAFVVLEALADWDRTDGLLMSWRGGGRLMKAGVFDGHATNGDAFADPSRDEFVFATTLHGLSTRPDRTTACIRRRRAWGPLAFR